ncbi:hypothetical protein BO86DRAFT_395429 [Aspergillus japonicus CBS 114.51]|uniref:Uncharacterized protein n=1 Tax=Aspergillus japonicus CBS 114.51 TaxID=1448312 RepID=A0A8T8XCJ8_ASPJA|nr:hypothetical protein BO86DRAFT_395429 [Aspergillus japonicus CBS 114.51]RAH85983.1 hypothetical protein BO86DRAFT_395429 [Aspergillus japonicus CBS 114.51]
MLVDFNLFNQLDDVATHVSIAACTADFKSSSSLASSIAKRGTSDDSSCFSGSVGLSTITSSVELASSGDVSSTGAADIINALEQVQNTLAVSGSGCKEMIRMATSDQAAVGVYVGSGLGGQGVISSVLDQLLTEIDDTGSVARQTLVQVCDNSTARYSLGVFASSTADLASVQRALQSWRNSSCVSSMEETIPAWQTITFLGPSAPQNSSLLAPTPQQNSTLENNHTSLAPREHLHSQGHGGFRLHRGLSHSHLHRGRAATQPLQARDDTGEMWCQRSRLRRLQSLRFYWSPVSKPDVPIPTASPPDLPPIPSVPCFTLFDIFTIDCPPDNDKSRKTAHYTSAKASPTCSPIPAKSCGVLCTSNCDVSSTTTSPRTTISTSTCSEASTVTDYWVSCGATACSTTSTARVTGCDVTATTTTTGRYCLATVSVWSTDDQGENGSSRASGQVTLADGDVVTVPTETAGTTVVTVGGEMLTMIPAEPTVITVIVTPMETFTTSETSSSSSSSSSSTSKVTTSTTSTNTATSTTSKKTTTSTTKTTTAPAETTSVSSECVGGTLANCYSELESRCFGECTSWPFLIRMSALRTASVWCTQPVTITVLFFNTL